MPEAPGVPDSDAGLRAANGRLRELLCGCGCGCGTKAQAPDGVFGCAPSPGALAAAAKKKTAGLIARALRAITAHLTGAEIAHLDETGFRTAGKLAWVHSASSGTYVLVTVQPSAARTG